MSFGLDNGFPGELRDGFFQVADNEDD